MRRVSVAVLLCVVVLPLAAQRLDDAITVNLVEVPVSVERFGHPVEGLTRDDFELLVNGRPHPIDGFEVIDERAPDVLRTESSTAEPVDLDRRSLVVLLFDTGSSSVQAMHRARTQALQYLAEHEAGDTFAVATIARRGVRFVVPFTSDRVALQRAIGTLMPSEAQDPFGVATLEVERASWSLGIGNLNPRHPFLSEEEEHALGTWLFMDDLAELADRLAPLPGIKRVVLLSGRTGVTDRRMIDPEARVHERFRAAGVVLDGVDVRPPRVPGGVDERRIGEAPSLLLSPLLYALASDTGGIVDATLQNLERRNRVTYLLTFVPPATERKTNSIRVRLRDRSLFMDVRYRSAYTIGEPTIKDEWLFLADTLLHDIPQRGVTVDVAVRNATVIASIPGVELLSYPSEEPLTLDAYVYVFDEGTGSQPVIWNRMRVDVDLEKGREFLSEHPYTIRQTFDLPPGRYAAKVIVRIAGSDRIGFAREDFVAP